MVGSVGSDHFRFIIPAVLDTAYCYLFFKYKNGPRIPNCIQGIMGLLKHNIIEHILRVAVLVILLLGPQLNSDIQRVAAHHGPRLAQSYWWW